MAYIFTFFQFIQIFWLIFRHNFDFIFTFVNIFACNPKFLYTLWQILACRRQGDAPKERQYPI